MRRTHQKQVALLDAGTSILLFRRNKATLILKIHGDEQTLRVDLANTSWKAQDVDELVLALSSDEVGALKPLPGHHHWGL